VGKVAERRTTGALAFLTVRFPDGAQVEVSTAINGVGEGAEVGLVPLERGIHLFPAERA
jgi:hypothetical protein